MFKKIKCLFGYHEFDYKKVEVKIVPGWFYNECEAHRYKCKNCRYLTEWTAIERFGPWNISIDK